MLCVKMMVYQRQRASTSRRLIVVVPSPHQRLATTSWWCRPRINVSPPHRGGAVPAPSYERWPELARQLSRGVQPSGHSHSSERGCTF